MFDNIGGKIKGFAKIIAWLGIILSVIFGLLSIEEGGIMIMIIGSVSSWLGSLVLYGFGQLVENSDKLVDALPKANTSVDISSPVTEPKEPAKPWTCYNCGTTNHARAAYCIKCDTNRGWSEEQSKQK